MKPLPPLDRIALAGTCVTCENYDPDACVYTDACLGCSRYYGDQYSERKPDVEQNPA